MVPLTLMNQFPNHFLCQRGSLPSLHHLHIHREKSINNQQVGYVGFPDIAIGPRSSWVVVGHKMPKTRWRKFWKEMNWTLGGITELEKHHTARIRYVTCWCSIHHYIFYCIRLMHYYAADTFDQCFPLSLEAGRALLDFLYREGTRTLNMKVAELTTGLMNC